MLSRRKARQDEVDALVRARLAYLQQVSGSGVGDDDTTQVAQHTYLDPVSALEGALSAAEPNVETPGRHAQRPEEREPLGPGGSWHPSLLLQRLGGRSSAGTVRFTLAHVALLAALVAVGSGVGVYTWSASQDVGQAVPPRAAGPAMSSAPATSVSAAGGADGQPPTEVASGLDLPGSIPAGRLTGVSAPAQTSPVEGTVIVDVAGKVRRPGIVTLPAGARVVDAIRAAGGPRRGADLSTVNQARVLVDGEQLLVGVVAQKGAPVGNEASAGANPTGALVSLNQADQAALETLPGIGPVTATAIIAWRAEHGGFTAVEELLEVSGIGETTLSNIAPFLTL